MGLQWDNQPASRFIKYQSLSWTRSGVAVSTGLQKMASNPRDDEKDGPKSDRHGSALRLVAP
jgi:hypothetical protein